MATIELIPVPLFGAVDGPLALEATRSSRTRAAVAFWTVPADFIGQDFIRAVSGQGFLCVDIHLPTSIDHLAELDAAGANVYLHLFDLAGQTEDPGIVGMPQHLMHAKLLLFDRSGGQACLWIGSHNATQRALLGTNIEATAAIELLSTDNAYLQAESVLRDVQARCKRFDPRLIDYYKWLQGNDHSVPVIEVEDRTGKLALPQTISVFGTDLKDFSQLKQVDKEVFLSVSTGRTEHFYRCTIDESGNLAGNRTEFSDRRYALRSLAGVPVLEPLAPIPAAVYRSARYFVTLIVAEQLDERTVGYEVPGSEKRWIDADWEGECRRRGPEYSGKRGDRPARLRRAAPPEAMEGQLLGLDARNQVKGHGLVRRRVLAVRQHGD